MMAALLPTAIREDKFTVHYQPVYSIREGQYISLEALSRLQHPQLENMPAAGKSGTTSDNKDLWFAGYALRVST